MNLEFAKKALIQSQLLFTVYCFTGSNFHESDVTVLGQIFFVTDIISKQHAVPNLARQHYPLINYLGLTIVAGKMKTCETTAIFNIQINVQFGRVFQYNFCNVEIS